MEIIFDRSGKKVKTLNGYECFIPKKLPPDPCLVIDEEMQKLMSEADRKLGRLDGITQILPNPQLFVAMYVKKEALLSAQIEGTQASLVDVLNESQDGNIEVFSPDGVSEVVNYVDAMQWGLQELSELPLSLRLIREIHGRLLKNVRGANKNPGEFRKTQNWIGPAGCSLKSATFVPPEPSEMINALADLEQFMNGEDNIPSLIKIALIHAQFETIHPFLDGNGRMGRLLITFWLCQQNILSQPLLYLSYYFKMYRTEYYDLLMDVRVRGNWEEWIKFFLKGVATVSDEATESAKSIIKLQQRYTDIINNEYKGNGNYLKLLNSLFEVPIVNNNLVVNMLGVSQSTARSIVEEFCKMGVLSDETPNKQRYKKYLFKEYFDILRRGTDM